MFDVFSKFHFCSHIWNHSFNFPFALPSVIGSKAVVPFLSRPLDVTGKTKLDVTVAKAFRKICFFVQQMIRTQEY